VADPNRKGREWQRWIGLSQPAKVERSSALPDDQRLCEKLIASFVPKVVMLGVNLLSQEVTPVTLSMKKSATCRIAAAAVISIINHPWNLILRRQRLPPSHLAAFCGETFVMNPEKGVFITGCTRGLGRAMIPEFIQRGWRVVGCGEDRGIASRVRLASLVWGW